MAFYMIMGVKRNEVFASAAKQSGQIHQIDLKLSNMSDNTKQLILIIEDESDIRDMLRFALRHEFEILTASDAQSADASLGAQHPDLILLDWMLPKTSGIDYMRQLKSNPNTQDIPIIILTAKAEEENKIKGLETGADDYITKPFSPKELIARIKVVLRRGPLVSASGVISVGHLRVESHKRKVWVKDTEILMNPMSYKLLYFLIRNQDRVFTREQLLDRIWGQSAEIDDRTVDVHIRRLRNALKPSGYDRLLQTIHGAGYLFSSENEAL